MVNAMDFKTVSKSKSSNSAIASKAEKRKNKGSRSNAEIQPQAMKKRGVYVEKKIQPIDAEGAKGAQIKRKPPPRPRAGQKKFLASVLTILSKYTTGTQYPDIDENNDTKNKIKLKPKGYIDQDAEPEAVKKILKKKKKIYKSRILNNEKQRCEQEQFVVLQSKKDIVQTPSNNSEWSKNASDSIKWSDMLHNNDQHKKSAIRKLLENNIYSGEAEALSQLIIDDKTKREKKLRINEDPVTLASEIANKDDKKLYNFFVDLLETTISVYNVKAEYDCEPSDISKTVLEINESVAQKLDVKNDEVTCDNVSVNKQIHADQTAKHCYEFNSQENIPIEIKLSEHKPLALFKRKVKTKSCIYPYYKRQPNSNIFNTKKRFSRKNDKKTLLNILKEQLELDTYNFEEPGSLYDALKVMARNKKKYEISICFDKKVTKPNEDFDAKCIIKSRKVISFRSKRKNKALSSIGSVSPTRCRYSGQRNNNEINRKTLPPSNHSLQVYGYDYEEPVGYPKEKTRKKVIFPYHSSPSESEYFDDYNALLKYQIDSSTSSNYSYIP